MPGIIPNTTSGAVEVRDTGGNCLVPIGVTNTYCPAAAFTSTCALSFLPDGCGARITAAQINAFQSEMLCLAEKFNPTGNWNCGAVCNLSTMFNSWMTGAYAGSLRDRVQQIICNAAVMTHATLVANPTAGFVMCDGAGNLAKYLGRPYITPLEVVNAICGDGVAKTTLQNCLTPLPELVVTPGFGLSVTAVVGVDGKTTYTLTQAAATDTTFGVVQLAVGANYPAPLNDTDPATPMYVRNAINAIPNDPLTPLAGIAGLTALSRGKSLGEVDIPTNRALTVAEMTAANSMNVSVPLGDMQSVFTSKAAEPSAPGVMNFDGTLGHRLLNIGDLASGAALDITKGSGLLLRLSGAAGSTFTLPAPAHTGQILEIRAPYNSEIGSYGEVILTSTAGFGGVARDSQHRITELQTGTPRSIILRSNEALRLVGFGGVWFVMQHNYRLFPGSNTLTWVERVDGKVDINTAVNFVTPIPAGQTNSVDLTLPLAIAAHTGTVHIMDVSGGAIALGNTASLAGNSPAIYAEHVPNRTATSMRLSARNPYAAAQTPGTVYVSILGTTPDYAALGGVASF